MTQNPDDGAGDSAKARSSAGTGNGSESVSSNLPMVVAPRLGAGEDETIEETIGAAAGGAANSTTHTQSARFLMLAGTVAFAAAFGSFIGSVSGSGMVRFMSPIAPAASPAPASDAMREMKLELGELVAIKANLDSASRSTTTQFAKLADRLDRIDRRDGAAADTTGSIPAPLPAVPPTAAKINDRILQDWIVQDVQNGRALLQSRYGGMFDVGEGSVLPGIGRVDSIKRQDGQWLVLTEHGTITSGR